MTKIKLFIDFDDTLIDRNRFRNDMFELLKKQGFTDQELEGSYRMVYGDGYEGIWAHIDFLHQNVRSFDKQSVTNQMSEFLKNCPSYLFPETIPFLEQIDRSAFDIQLLTVGGLDFQKLKVKSSGIEKYFNCCNYTAEEKAKALEKLVSKNEPFILFDDKDKEVANVSANFPKATVIQVIGGELLVHIKMLNQLIGKFQTI